MRAVSALIVSGLLGCGAAAKPPTTTAPPESCTTCEESSGDARPSDAKYRVVERTQTAPEKPQEPPFDPFDPTVPEALVASDANADVAGEFDAKIGEAATLFRGDFARSSGEELVIVEPAELRVLSSSGKTIAKADLGAIEPDSLRAVRLVDDRLELVVVRREAADGPRVFSVYRVIGSAAAEVFRVDLTDTAVEFVHRGDERAIRVTGKGDPAVYRWNRWEGVFRIPRRAPTAPIR